MKNSLLLLLLVGLSLNGFAQSLTLPDTTRVCQLDQVEIEADQGFKDYLWNTGATTSAIAVTDDGWYTVTVNDAIGNVLVDSTFVHFLSFDLSPKNSLVNCGDEVTFVVSPDSYTYQWEGSSETGNQYTVYPNEDQWYYVRVTDDISTCRDSAYVDIESPFTVDFKQVLKSCEDECASAAIIHISGGLEPYAQTLWDQGPLLLINDSIARNLCPGDHTIKITDAAGCAETIPVEVEGLQKSEVTIQVSPLDTIFISNPTLEFSFQNESEQELVEWKWLFGDEQGNPPRPTTDANPTHTYDGAINKKDDTYNVVLEVVNDLGCTTTIAHPLIVLETLHFVPNVFIPNSTGGNQFFIIKNSNKHASAAGGIQEQHSAINQETRLELVVFNRYGRKVFESNDYQNDWDGGNLADGVYFYVLKSHGFFRTDEYKGSVHILRK